MSEISTLIQEVKRLLDYEMPEDHAQDWLDECGGDIEKAADMAAEHYRTELDWSDPHLEAHYSLAWLNR